MNSLIGKSCLLFKTEEIFQSMPDSWTGNSEVKLAPSSVLFTRSGFCLLLTCISFLHRDPSCVCVSYWEFSSDGFICGLVRTRVLDPPTYFPSIVSLVICFTENKHTVFNPSESCSFSSLHSTDSLHSILTFLLLTLLLHGCSDFQSSLKHNSLCVEHKLDNFIHSTELV